jgi:hypothetical protein
LKGFEKAYQVNQCMDQNEQWEQVLHTFFFGAGECLND